MSGRPCTWRVIHSQKKMLKWCVLSTYIEILAFSTSTWGGVFTSYWMWLVSWSIVCGFSSTNNRHLTDKVEFPPQIKCNQDLNNEVIYKMENAHWNKTIASMWNIQRMSFKVVGPHCNNNFFGRVYGYHEYFFSDIAFCFPWSYFFLILRPPTGVPNDILTPWCKPLLGQCRHWPY